MASAISIYSRGRFSINYYCCSRNPGELKTNKRMTTETDSLGSLYTFLPLPTRTRLSKLVRAAHSTSAATWHTPDVPYTHQGSRAVCGPELGGGGGWTRAGRPPASHCGGQPAAGSQQYHHRSPGKQRAADTEGRVRPPGSEQGGAARCWRRARAAPSGRSSPGQQPRAPSRVPACALRGEGRWKGLKAAHGTPGQPGPRRLPPELCTQQERGGSGQERRLPRLRPACFRCSGWGG